LRELAGRLAQAKSETARMQRTYDRIAQQAKKALSNLNVITLEKRK
jgi:hypothetical protein